MLGGFEAFVAEQVGVLAAGAVPVLGPPFQVCAPAKLVGARLNGLLERGPVSEQCLVRYFEDGAAAVSVAGQQPGGDERLGDPPLRICQRAAPHPAAGRLVLADRDEPQQGRQHWPGCAPELGGDLVGLAGQHTGDPADALVGVGGQHPTRPGGQAQLLQRVRQQGQGITAAGVGGHPLRQGRRVEGQSRSAGRLLDHLDQRCVTQRPHRDRITEQPSLLGAQERGQELRPHDHDDPQQRAGIQRAGQQAEEGVALGRSRQGDQLLGLIDDHQHRGARAAVRGAKLVGEVCSLHVVGGEVSRVRRREAAGETAQRMVPGHHRRHHDPAAAALPQPRHHTGLDQ